ncbi:uncharacterized protein [Rhodnius prolixus]|uniref:uncharacterized protein n=1 Tax=Rhodnius prolixus TaxID=13249 RepID=UPI003D18D66E
MDHILNINQEVIFNDNIENYQFHSYRPFNADSLSSNDEIRISMFQNDIFTLPSESYLFIEGKLEKNKKSGGGGDVADDPAATYAKLINNAFAFLFDEIRFEINSVEVDSIRNVGIASTLKIYSCVFPNQIRALENAGIVDPNNNSDNMTLSSSSSSSIINEEDQRFNVCLPLCYLLNFFEDYKKILVNVKQELILKRSRSDVDALVGDPITAKDCTIKLEKVIWNIPHVKLSDSAKLQIYKIIESAQPLPLAFRSSELHEYPNLPSTNKLSWHVKTSNQLHKPRYVIIAFQTDRKDNIAKNRSIFDSADIRNVKLYLNDNQYPYNDMQLDFTSGRISQLFEEYIRFRQEYYGVGRSEALFDRKGFSKTPFVVINCAKQPDRLNTGVVDIHIQIDTNKPFAPKTSAYCLIIHDMLLHYVPLSGLVQRY